MSCSRCCLALQPQPHTATAPQCLVGGSTLARRPAVSTLLPSWGMWCSACVLWPNALCCAGGQSRWTLPSGGSALWKSTCTTFLRVKQLQRHLAKVIHPQNHQLLLDHIVSTLS
ncbi:hypothetical protein DUNSADRAFT_1911 [Dunaliella salina]|uniref:Encoded protein n=1 Tax=Dunaliella salina TaxID=3046 RepID=A0ABQ7GWG9_DUNSA|nr:hypothetical protein DUNSADRAFT_1911 [Dunaliella salina]|eukprot:KAF5838966.1 hypothetical protein DUNSADRAFT_1911 [Dunaliella salina]